MDMCISDICTVRFKAHLAAFNVICCTCMHKGRLGSPSLVSSSLYVHNVRRCCSHCDSHLAALPLTVGVRLRLYRHTVLYVQCPSTAIHCRTCIAFIALLWSKVGRTRSGRIGGHDKIPGINGHINNTLVYFILQPKPGLLQLYI